MALFQRDLSDLQQRRRLSAVFRPEIFEGRTIIIIYYYYKCRVLGDAVFR